MTADNYDSLIHSDSFDVRGSACPACGCHVAVPFFDGGAQPLATLAWPGSAEEARGLKRLPLDFVRCFECGHIYNSSFKYEEVPYSEKPNLMFNKGTGWAEFIRKIQGDILSRLPDRPTVVEIGHGAGSFLSSLASSRPGGRYVGFDPHGAFSESNLVQLRQELFDPARHLISIRPDILVSRHVLEHMTNPLGFLQKISCVAASMRIRVLAYLEVPCIDRVLETGRTTDFYYEHCSQFTTGSFTRMLESSFSSVEDIGHGYDGEVVYGFVRLGEGSPLHLGHAREARRFHDASRRGCKTIKGQLDELHASGRRIAIWGGTGKGAAFINRYGADAERFPIVVDSDADKLGTFVPGTGQKIRSRDWLRSNMVDVVIIPSQWRVCDIIDEIHGLGIIIGSVLIEHNGMLVDYCRDPHPYRALAFGRSTCPYETGAVSQKPSARRQAGKG